MNIENMTIARLLKHYRDGDFTPKELIESILERSAKLEHYNSWIYRLSMGEIQPYLDQLADKSVDDLPLYGIPFAIKDNIDLQGVPTTAACEAFRYTPDKSARVVELLLNAGAIPIGKTNLDQFATGLVGTRSPYGITKNAFNDEYISGGSSSGSAVVVAQGLVSFALGTDTAGSGRVPAAFNNILGLKPTRGRLSNRGVVPACKTLDCVALFATTADDLSLLAKLTQEFDPEDAFSRKYKPEQRSVKKQDATFTFAVPSKDQLEFFSDQAYTDLFNDAVKKLNDLGGKATELDFSPFAEAAKLLYEGPWVSERYLACKDIIDSSPEDMLEVTRNIIGEGKDKRAADMFSAIYKLQEFKQITDGLINEFDFLLTPTTGTIYTIAEVENNPVQLNSNLGYYTNYMNLLDYAAIAIPAGFTRTGLPFGISLVSSAFSDERLLLLANRFQQAFALPLGATSLKLPDSKIPSVAHDHMKVVVCGAHMSGLSLNHQLLERDAVFIKKSHSSANYKLVALPGGPPERPGMIRVERGGVEIEVEVWELPQEHLGSFLQGIPHPLGLGKIELNDGSWETGFICEGYQEKNAKNISQFGGWRGYLEQK